MGFYIFLHSFSVHYHRNYIFSLVCLSEGIVFDLKSLQSNLVTYAIAMVFVLFMVTCLSFARFRIGHVV